MNKAPRLLVFDSGVGGLSVCREIIAAFPALELHYLSDNAGFPYGEKLPEQLVERARRLIGRAVEQLSPQLVVIACNTASTVVLPALRNTLDIPVVGVVPAIKTAAAISKTKTIALLATPGTANRDYTLGLIAAHAAEHQVIRLGNAELVTHIEAHIHGASLDRLFCQSIIHDLRERHGGEHIDTVVLGCTHFPLIDSVFKEIEPHWQWIDSGAAIAARVGSLLALETNTARNQTTTHSFWLSAASDSQPALDRYLAALNFKPSQVLPGR